VIAFCGKVQSRINWRPYNPNNRIYTQLLAPPGEGINLTAMILHRLEGAEKEERARSVENRDGNRPDGCEMGKAESQRVRNPPTAARSRCIAQSRVAKLPVSQRVRNRLWPFPEVLAKEGCGDRFLISPFLSLNQLHSSAIHRWLAPITLQNRECIHPPSIWFERNPIASRRGRSPGLRSSRRRSRCAF